MTLDQSLANLQQQADRLANLFASTADAIEARTAHAAVAVSGTAVGKSVELVYDPAKGQHEHWGMQKPMPQPPEARDATPAEAAAIAHAATEPTADLDRSQPPFTQPQSVQPPTAPMHPGAPAGTFAPEPASNGDLPPWDVQAAVEAEKPAEEKPAKKSGRRTNEELAAEAGVDLNEVKAWLGEGKRVTKASIEEFAKLKASQNSQTAPEAPQFDNGGQPVAQQWPQAQPVAPQPPAQQEPWPPQGAPQPAEGFQQWGGAQQFDPSDPFGS